MKKSYVYKITCLVTGEFYFGSSFKAKWPTYWGGGSKIRERIEQYGKENFIKEILHEFDDRTNALKKENEYIEKFINDEKCLNHKCEHNFGAYSEKVRLKMGLKGKSNPNFGRKHSEESIKKMSEIKMGVKNPLFGKKLSEITKKKLSELYKGKHWRKNPITGKREWYD